MFPELSDLSPSMHSGDGRNPFPGPLTCPFVVYDLPDGTTLQFTISSRDDAGNEEHFVKGCFRYPTPASRFSVQHVQD